MNAVSTLSAAALAERIFGTVGGLTRDDPGVSRESFGAGESRAMEAVAAIAAELGLACETDAYKNLWMRLPEDARAAPPVILGSHLDSVPHGGNFDGLAGVAAAMMALARYRGRAAEAPPLRALALRGEESAWYGKAYLGSLALTGKLGGEALALRHRDGHGTLGGAMAMLGIDTEAIRAGKPLLAPGDAAAYLELHIEQGPVMTARGWPVTAVTGIRGNLRHNAVRCTGEAGHSGAVPRWLRKDAVLAVAELLSRMDEHWRVLLQMGMDLVMTSGICTTSPDSHAVSVIPGEVRFSLEIRSQDAATMERFYDLVREECRAVEKSRGVAFTFDTRIDTAPATMDPAWIARLQAASLRLGSPLETIPSGAGHDAAVFANAGIPAAMVFVRNENGSHNPHEAMDIADFLKGVDLLTEAVRTV
ncbi:hydantoinase/carbamoylase family amidase [Oleispirillum naphthae]|uniref:hydantoinase/carbamoylase family amidase n=1 Tax=Oleispirillum naphthae TaxID=2838853 RepID=UPI00308259E1